MATQDELAQELADLRAQVAKIGTETSGLLDAKRSNFVFIPAGIKAAMSALKRIITPITPVVPQIFFQDGFETGNTSAWDAGSIGGLTVLNNTQAYNGTFHGSIPLTNGTNNDFGLFRNHGTAGTLSTQIRDFYSQISTSFDSFTGNWPASDQQKLFIYQYYDTQWASFSNARRKFQVIVGVAANSLSQRGQYYIQLIEWNDVTGTFVQGTNVFQNSTTVGPANSFGSWDVLRLQVQLDTNGSATLGTGQGNGILRLWCNNTLILQHTDVNICRGNANVGMGRLLLSTTCNPSTWAGTTTAAYFDRFQIANDTSVLDNMPSSATPRVSSSGDNNPDSITTGTTTHSKDYETQVGADIRTDPLVNFTWASNYGYGPSGGWRAQPNPITAASNGNNAEVATGWQMPTSLPGITNLATISFMFKATASLLDAIETTGSFWSHMNKSLDLGGGGVIRYGAQFGEFPPQWHLSGGGGGPFFASGVDWRQYADQWVWVCFLADERGSTSATRYTAIYIKPEGATSVTRIVRIFENQGLPTFTGTIPGFVLTPLFGYWDDMGDRALVEAAGLSNMFIYLDRVRICSGWPSGSDGPPF